MDVSGQSVLPLAAIVAIFAPSYVLKATAMAFLAVIGGLALFRLKSRGDRAQVTAQEPPRVVRSTGYRGTRRAD
ncbi:hypothetical protein ACTI_44420 [Actinoplanes sp. OR16]|uniref:hypothetical protein n=1 Tax=Actinoplanes sp. OR16 TaxID=946334 RepID=UPI000F6E63C9|nr:hypothetical protein [Actinoplanes sp. OR16]BBH67757.1 hypothetical protein ACTI_44420 [Actinoplanes sp. OR16]